MLRRFVLAFLSFVGLVVPTAFALALLAAPPARPQPASLLGLQSQSGGCNRQCSSHAGPSKKFGRHGRNGNLYRHTRLYFLELVKARAVTALCKNGAERDRDLGRFDADVEHTNEAIA